jgi:hypothetical protein
MNLEKAKVKVIRTAKQFKKMSSSEICRLMESDKRFWIIDDENGRRIIRK